MGNLLISLQGGMSVLDLMRLSVDRGEWRPRVGSLARQGKGQTLTQTYLRHGYTCII